MAGETRSLDKAAGRFGLRFAEVAAQGVLGLLLAGFFFPLLDLGTIVPALLVFAAIAFYVVRRLGWRIITLTLLALFVGTAFSVLSLTFRSGTKYVVEVDNIGDAIWAKSATGPRGSYYLVPTYSAIPVKWWLLKGLSGLGADFVFLSATASNGRYVAQSPSELAAAAISRKPPNTYGWLFFPTRAEQLILSVQLGEGTLSNMNLTYGAHTFGPAFGSSIGPGNSGLFGISTQTRPTLSDWQSLAYSEELIRSFPTASLPEIFYSLHQESERTGSWTDLLRELTLRLALMSGRYGDAVSRTANGFAGIATTRDSYELAVIGNLRAVAEAFNARNPEKSLYGNPWLRELSYKLLNTVGAIPFQPLTLPDERGSRELKWLVDTLKKISDLEVENSLTSALNTSDEQPDPAGKILGRLAEPGQAQDPAAIIRALGDAMRATTTSEKPVKTGDDITIADFQKRLDSLGKDEVLDWIRAGGAERAYRVDRVSELLAADGWMEKFAELIARPNEQELKKLMMRWTRQFALVQDITTAAIPLVEDADERRLLASELGITRGIMAPLLGMMDRAWACQTNKAEPLCRLDDGRQFMSLMMASFSPDVRNSFLDLLDLRDGKAIGAIFADNQLGPPYSVIEFRYAGLLTGVLYSTDLRPQDVGIVCERVRQNAQALLLEDRLVERASIAALEIEVLQRCGAEEAGALEKALRERQMPLASWFGQVAPRIPWSEMLRAGTT